MMDKNMISFILKCEYVFKNIVKFIYLHIVYIKLILSQT